MSAYRTPDYLGIARRALDERQRRLREGLSVEEPARPAAHEVPSADTRAVCPPAPRLTPPGAPCPTCGATPAELAAVRTKRAKDAAFDAWDAHVRACKPCAWWNRKHVREELRGNGERAAGWIGRCAEGERLAGAFFDRWTAWLAAGREGAARRGA